jgi:hypothetical protein
MSLAFNVKSKRSSRNSDFLYGVHRMLTLYHLGVKQSVDQTTFSLANEKRDWRIFADFGEYLIGLFRPLYADFLVPNVNISNEVFTLDSTTISLSINLYT